MLGLIWPKATRGGVDNAVEERHLDFVGLAITPMLMLTVTAFDFNRKFLKFQISRPVSGSAQLQPVVVAAGR